MGKPAARLGDLGSNHGAWHPSPITAGSGDVFTNSIPAARKGDSLAPHVKPKSKPHGRSIKAGSGSVFINGKQAARVGDPIDCGGTVAAGSGNVFIGDDPQLIPPVEIKPIILRAYYEYRDGTSIPKNQVKPGDEINWVVISLHAVGKTISIDLSDNSHDFEYNGSPLENDKMSGVVVSGDIHKVPLKVIKQKNT
ncbi:MAG: PAAR domain-containing protein [Cellvibrionaceae bacterium]